MRDNQDEKADRIERLKKLFRSMQGRKPDYDNLEQPVDQTEASYQEEQKKWLQEVRQRKMEKTFTVTPIGMVHKTQNRTWIELDPRYQDAVLGLEGFSHINVLFWFHENDTPEGRSMLQVHPRRDPQKPLTGVFATHSPRRPNLIGLTRCKVLSVAKTAIEIASIDARDQTPVLDIKCYIPDSGQAEAFRVPDWV